jgi:hypothetical protein
LGDFFAQGGDCLLSAVFCKLQKIPHFWATYFHGKGFRFCQKLVGLFFGQLLSQTHLVILASTRVSRLGDFSPIGRLLTYGSFCKLNNFWATFFPQSK